MAAESPPTPPSVTSSDLRLPPPSELQALQRRNQAGLVGGLISGPSPRFSLSLKPRKNRLSGPIRDPSGPPTLCKCPVTGSGSGGPPPPRLSAPAAAAPPPPRGWRLHPERCRFIRRPAEDRWIRRYQHEPLWFPALGPPGTPAPSGPPLLPAPAAAV